MYQEKVIKILENQLGVVSIIPSDYLSLNLAMDSLDVALVANAIEYEFKLPQDSILNYMSENFQNITVEDLSNFVGLARQPLKRSGPKKKKQIPALTNAQLKELYHRFEEKQR